MNDELTEDDELLRNLKDAGCSPRTLEQFFQGRRNQSVAAQRLVLSAQRRRLLDRIHKDQLRLDRLDHLLFRLNKTDWNHA